MRTKYEFETLELDEQLKLVFSGEFISSIPFENRTSSLYIIESHFYVEVFSEEDSKEIDFISLASEERLPLYIDLDKMMKSF